ncbi:MAG: GNAT family N-acetyltransferase [Gemmatimonadota bacterium]|nr:GNAT family N-acetyltransferase [Gemmatimonadota bacterium]
MSDDRSPVQIREATEADAGAIIELFIAGYGDGYMYPQYYEDLSIRKMILSEGTLMFVAEDASGRLVGTASVMLEIGAYSDLIGELGRLVVHPEFRNQGVATHLMRARLDRVKDRLHVGIVEARTIHPYACRLATRHEFAPVGMLPNGLVFSNSREHAVLYMRHFGDALSLRNNHPRIIPEAYALAGLAMENVGLDLDVIVDEQAAPYPHGGDVQIEKLQAEGYTSLLRIERGRVRNREVFGPLQLHYGRFKLLATHAHYLIARDGGRVVGAVGFILDRQDLHLRIFELIQVDQAVARQLLADLGRRAVEEWDLVTIEIDVAANAPSLQRTLLELDYRPAAYLPAHSFHAVERRDVVKMWRLLQPAVVPSDELPAAAMTVTEVVLEQLRQQERRPRIRRALEDVLLCSDLTEEQAGRIEGLLEYTRLETGERLFERGEPGDRMFLVTEGRVTIEGEDGAVGEVGPGGCVGEVALLTRAPHSATAVASEPVEAGTLGREPLERLVRQRPDIGVALYRNLARELGEKLKQADLDISGAS